MLSQMCLLFHYTLICIWDLECLFCTHARTHAHTHAHAHTHTNWGPMEGPLLLTEALPDVAEPPLTPIVSFSRSLVSTE